MSIIRGYMIEIAVSDEVRDCIYEPLVDTFVCSYLRIGEMKKAMLQRPEEARSRLKANKAVPHNIIYHINEEGFVRKYLIVDEDISHE